MIRKDIYRLIDGERNYQDTDPHGTGHNDEARSIADWLIFIDEHIRRAKEWVYELKPARAMSEMRKIAALAVACMEHNKTPPRR